MITIKMKRERTNSPDEAKFGMYVNDTRLGHLLGHLDGDGMEVHCEKYGHLRNVDFERDDLEGDMKDEDSPIWCLTDTLQESFRTILHIEMDFDFEPGQYDDEDDWEYEWINAEWPPNGPPTTTNILF